MASPLDAVLNHPAIWRGNDCARVVVPGVPTGFAELDALLPGRGWPAEALIEIYVERPGMGELQIVMPAAARLTQAERWLVMIAPPHIPYAPALLDHGVRLSRLMLIRPQTVAAQLWAGEQALRSESCGAVMLWLNRVQEQALRRLQVAAERSGALTMLFRTARAPAFSSAALRLHVSKVNSQAIVRILKRRSGGIPAPVALDLHSAAAMRPVILRQSAAIARLPAMAH
jgi:cell division inhibitor SulA/protein ImuA